MKKKISVLVSALAALSIFATACDSKHTHTFSEDWESDATNHWHAATCEHGEEKSALAKHKDEDEDGKCDVCAYEVGHTHTYAEDWSKDDTHHWHAATCTHTGEVADKGLHEDVAADGTCDVCGGHAHVVNKAGVCDVCDEQVKPMDETNLEMVIAATALQYKNVASGEVDYAFTSIIHSEQDSDGNYGYTESATNVEYTLGNGATEVKRTDTNTTYSTASQTDPTLTLRSYSSNINLWIYTDSDDTDYSYKAVQEYIYNDEVEISIVNQSQDGLYGFWYVLPNYADGYGAENFLASLYEYSQAETASNFEEDHNPETNTYTFSFTSLIVGTTETSIGTVHNAALFETEVSFTYTDDYALTSLSVSTDSYSTDAGEGSADDISLTYDPETKTATKIDGKQPNNYIFEVTQEVGERTYTHTKTVDSFTPTANDFTFSIDGTAVTSGATLNYTPDEIVEEGEWYDTEGVLFIDINYPEGTYFDLAYGDLLNNNFSATTVDSPALAMVYKDGYIKVSNLIFNMSYNLTVKYLDTTIFTATITITDGMDLPTPPTEGDYITVRTVDFDTWFSAEYNATYNDNVVVFTADKAGDYTFTLPAGYGLYTYDSYRDWGNPEVNYETNTAGATYTASLAAGESFAFYLSAPRPKNLDHYISYTFVEDTTGGSQGGGGDSGAVTDITGTYYGTSDGGSSYPLTVTIDATTVTFNYAPPYGNPQTYVCDYTIDGNTVTLTKDGTAVNALQAKLTVENGVLTVAGYNGWDYDLTTTQPGGGGDTNPVDITGTYYGTDNWGNQSLTVTIDATTVTFAFANPMGTQTYVCDYAIDGDTVTLTKDGEAVPGLQATLTVEDGVLTAASYNGTDYTLSTSQSGGDVGGGDTSNTPTLSIGPNNIEVSEDDITNQVIVYSFVVEEEGTYSFASNNLGAQIVTAMGTQFGSAYLSEGTYTINVVTAYLSEGDAGTYTLTIEYTAPDTGDSGDTGETEGSMDNPITWSELPSSIETTENYVYYTYTATADGILSVSWATAVGYAEMYDATYDAYVYSSEATESFLAITKGTAYTIVLACIEGTGTATATISFQEIDVLTHNIYEDEAPVNTITITADDIEKGALQYALIVKDAGKYTLVCEDFAIMQIKDNLGVKGVNSADLEAGLYTVIIVLENVEAGEYELTIGYTSPAGSMDNPIVWAELPSSVEVSSDSYIYYTYTPATAGTITFTWSVEGSADGSIVDESSIGVYTEYNSSTLTHNLTAGETYTISLSAWEDSTVTITFTPAA